MNTAYILHVYLQPMDAEEEDFIVAATDAQYDALVTRLDAMEAKFLLAKYELVWINNSTSPMEDLTERLDELTEE